MKPFIYMPYFQKEPHKRRIHIFVETYKERLAPQFMNIDKEAREAASRYLSEAGVHFNSERDDPARAAEEAHEVGLESWENMNLMKYNTYMMNLATLYQIWEQQIRELAYNEITRHHNLNNDKGKKIDFKYAFTTFNKIEDLFKSSDWNPTSETFWATINELRLVQNVIKHGDGSAADQLKSIQPGYFQTVSGTLLINLYNTTLNEVVLSIGDTEIDRYRDAIIEFWDEMPERVYFTLNNVTSK